MAFGISRRLTRRHTSVVVFGQEICFGRGIEMGHPGSMRYGSPVQKLEMGITHIPLDVYEEYLESLKLVWTYVMAH